MRFWDIVYKTKEILENDVKDTSPKFKRHGLVVYNENVMGPRGEIGPVMKCVSIFLSDNFKNMDHKQVMDALTTEPDKWYDAWVKHCQKHGADKPDAYEFGWDWMTSGEGLVTPSNNL